MFKKTLKKRHLQELDRERCKRYYERHKQELKIWRKYGSKVNYQRHQEKIKQDLENTKEQEKKKQQNIFLL